MQRNCKNHLSQEHPNWKQYKDVLQSQLREALQKVNGTFDGHPEKGLQESECDIQANVIKQSTMGQFVPSVYNEHNLSSRSQFPQSTNQDLYTTPPEKPRRSLPRIFDEQSSNVLTSLTPMSYQSANHFALQQQQQQQQDGIIHLKNTATSQQMHIGNLQHGLLPATVVPVGYSPQIPILMQVPLGQQMPRVTSQEEVYFVPNNVQPSTGYQQIQTPQQVVPILTLNFFYCFFFIAITNKALAVMPAFCCNKYVPYPWYGFVKRTYNVHNIYT